MVVALESGNIVTDFSTRLESRNMNSSRIAVYRLPENLSPSRFRFVFSTEGSITIRKIFNCWVSLL